jgi:hypothetical protein
MIRKIKVDNESLVGFVTLKMPTYEEKLLISKTMSVNESESSQSDKIDSLITLSNELKKRLQEVSLTSKDETLEVVIVNFDELSTIAEGVELINELIRIMLNGVPMGKTLK